MDRAAWSLRLAAPRDQVGEKGLSENGPTAEGGEEWVLEGFWAFRYFVFATGLNRGSGTMLMLVSVDSRERFTGGLQASS